ncbi:MAG: hypothetical protein IIA85_01045 [Nanoarchaeota archaeon]|nr:hypothetical protein [Nanoarchaeota archaeon]
MKKKVNVFGKSIPVFVIAFFAMVLVSAALVPYLSNTVFGNVEVKSPISIAITGQSSNVVIGTNPESYSASLFGGQGYFIETTLTNNIAGLTGYIAESVIFDFDGEGITVKYTDNLLVDAGLPSLTIVGCQAIVDNVKNTYYYIGDPNFELPGTLVSTTTVTTALNLEPRTYESNTTIILVEDVKCGPLSSP